MREIAAMSILKGTSLTLPLRPSARGEAPWEILGVLPRQGDWTVAAYRNIEFEGPLVELNNGCLEVLPMPTWMHQTIMGLLWMRLRDHAIGGRRGLAVMPPFNFHTIADQYRHPDVMYLTPEHVGRFNDDHWNYADLVIEIASEGTSDRERDFVEKRAEYAAAGIPEYWIVDPAARTILVLSLDGAAYREAGTYAAGDVARSVVLAGFAVDVGRMFAEADPNPPPS